MILLLFLLGGCAGLGVVKIDLSDYGSGAEIFVDGDFKGKMLTGTYEITLSEGKHELELIKPLSDPNQYDQFYAKETIMVADKSTQLISPRLNSDSRLNIKHRGKINSANKEKW